MADNYKQGNDASRDRLKKLVDGISDKELELVIYQEGWTIAVVLGHLAFWDQRRCELAKRWRKNDIRKSDVTELDMHTINDALIAVFKAMPARNVANLAVSAAAAVDNELAGLTPAQEAEVEKLGDRYALDRALHRIIHLDEIDVLLAAERGEKLS